MVERSMKRNGYACIGTLVAGMALGCGGGETAGAGNAGVDDPSQTDASRGTAKADGLADSLTNNQLRHNQRPASADAQAEDGSRTDEPSPSGPSGSASSTSLPGANLTPNEPSPDPAAGPAAGNPDGDCDAPSEAELVDTSDADQIVGNGTPASCTGDAFIEAVARGGIIRFDCGPDPVTITLDRPAKVVNDANDDVVIDGGGKVTLSGGGRTRILYMNTCDGEQHWSTDHCDNQDTPRLTVQNLTFVDGNSSAEEDYDGGGAIWVRGGRFKVLSSRFFNNECAREGADVGGGGIRVFSQYDGQPVYVVDSTFGGAEGFGNRGSNGGGISSIDVSWSILNSVFSHNQALGRGGNPAQDGTPGGGSGGAIYNDGDTMTLSVCGTRIEQNEVNAYGSAIFFVSNNHDGTLDIADSLIRDNAGGDWNVLPGISMHEDTVQSTINSTIE